MKSKNHLANSGRGLRFKNQVWSIGNETNTTSPRFSNSEGLGTNERKHWKKKLTDWLIASMKSYCSTTSMHGFSHMIREDSSSGERRAWIGIVIIAIIVSIALVWISWNWNEETPTVTVIESTHFPTWSVSFPAVTICNINKISKKKAMRIAKSMKRPSQMNESELINLFKTVMYYSGGVRVIDHDYTKLYEILVENDLTAQDLLNALEPSCNSMLFRCMWKGTQARCDSLFQTVNTTEGTCCSFNYYGMEVNNYPAKLEYTIPTEPRRITGCGFQTGLTILLKPNTQDYFGTYLSSFGFRILLHDPYDYPDENAETKVLTSLRESFLSISPESTYATKDARNLPIADRKCLFHNERRLHVMQRYSYSNCLAECRAQIIHEKCGCVPLNLPNNGTLPICDVDQAACVVHHRELYVGALPGVKATIVRQKRPDKLPCDCLPDCELNHYPAEITSGILTRDFSFSNVNLFKDVNLVDQVLLHVYFNDLISTRYRKDIYQNWLATLASFGGLLGLIIGFSIVTGFEFVYYLTLRPLFDHFSRQ